jgi:hypothetical protein
VNKLTWLWDVLVRERRLTRFSDAVNAAYERGLQQGYNQAIEQGYREAINDVKRLNSLWEEA